MPLADNGADVIKVEPPGGDPLRALPGARVWNRGKLSLTLDIETPDGRAALERLLPGTDVVLTGLAPGVTYAAHLHAASCASADPGGGHYQNNPPPPASPPNELWFSSTSDPFAGVIANRVGVAVGRGSADWVARPEAQAVVIHFIPPGGATASGPKIACADLE